jgi:hypothetical protein
MLRSLTAATIALLLGTVSSARADEVTPAPAAAPEPAPAATPLNYLTVAATTTLFHKPNSGSASGWQEDIGPVVGYGRYVTDTVALELDLGPSFVRGSGYTGFFLVPAAVWSFSTHVYAAARFLVEVDPEANRLPLRQAGFLTRDPRAVERKKPGRPGARKRFQFSKR